MARLNGDAEITKAQTLIQTDYSEKLGGRIRNNVTGAAVGLAAGAFYGIAKRKNLYLTSLIGMVIGGVASYLVSNKG